MGDPSTRGATLEIANDFLSLRLVVVVDRLTDEERARVEDIMGEAVALLATEVEDAVERRAQ